MNKFTRIYYGVAVLLFSLIFTNARAQCVVNSSTGYHVTLDVRPISIIAPATCNYGYNYNVSLLYNISFYGNNIPANLYTLQGNLDCNGQGNFFSLPKNGGSGIKTTSSNPWRSTPDCATASITSLNCKQIEITIQGPGIPQQVINCASAIALPVNLVSFNGRLVNNNHVSLSWVTASEINNKDFTVERSTDAITWTGVTTISAAGNSNTTRQYTFTDENLLPGMYYYRLKQTDISGAIAYSNIIGAKVTAGKAKDIAVYYSSNQLQFQGLGNNSGWELSVYNSAASAVMHTTSINAGTVQLPNLAPGIYFIRLKNKLDNTEKTLKFFKG